MQHWEKRSILEDEDNKNGSISSVWLQNEQDQDGRSNTDDDTSIGSEYEVNAAGQLEDENY